MQAITTQDLPIIMGITILSTVLVMGDPAAARGTWAEDTDSCEPVCPVKS